MSAQLSTRFDDWEDGGSAAVMNRLDRPDIVMFALAGRRPIGILHRHDRPHVGAA